MEHPGAPRGLVGIGIESQLLRGTHPKALGAAALRCSDIRDAGKAGALESSVFQDANALGAQGQLTFLEVSDLPSTRSEHLTWRFGGAKA